MATTTPNYGWDVPTSTDYVAQGAVAIETLGDDIDATLFSITGGKNVGLQHIVTTSVTGSSGIQINNCFTSAYTSYRIVMELTGSGNNFLFSRLSASGTPLATNTYQYGSRYWDSAAGSGAAENASGQAQWVVGYVTTAGSQSVIDITYPATAKATIFTGMSVQGSTAVQRTGQNSNATAYDGYYVLPNGITVTGTVSIYGYKV